MLNRILCVLAAVVLVTGMIACGGSSSGSFAPTPSPSPPPPVEELPITPANAAGITADVFRAVNLLFALPDVANAYLPIDSHVAKTGPGVSSVTMLAGLAQSLSSKQDTSWPRSIFVETYDCDSGSFTDNWDDADSNLEWSSGDIYEVSFADCYVAEWGETLTGSTYISSVSISGDVVNVIPPWSFSANYAFADLVCATNQESMTINGNFDMDNSSADGLIADLEFSRARFTVVADGATDTLRNFHVIEVMDLVNHSYTIDQTGTLTRDLRNGTVSFTTPVSMNFLSGDMYPSTGELLITHAASSVRATVIDNISVQLAIDADGDDIAETTLTVPWTALVP